MDFSSCPRIRILHRSHWPRHSGKTVLCRHIFDLPYMNLEVTDHRQFAQQGPRDFLSLFPDGVIIDEVQRVPDDILPSGIGE